MKTIALSINPHMIDKNALGLTSAYKRGWDAQQLTATELAEAINQGYAFSAQYSGGVRNTANFICADFLAADIDEGLTLAEAERHPLITQYGSLLYTTPSHQTDGTDRFRVVFATPYTIDSATVWSQALLGLAKTLGCDVSATDGARLFY
jgi:hypothetical protein